MKMINVQPPAANAMNKRAYPKSTNRSKFNFHFVDSCFLLWNQKETKNLTIPKLSKQTAAHSLTQTQTFYWILSDVTFVARRQITFWTIAVVVVVCRRINGVIKWISSFLLIIYFIFLFLSSSILLILWNLFSLFLSLVFFLYFYSAYIFYSLLFEWLLGICIHSYLVFFQLYFRFTSLMVTDNIDDASDEI